MARCPLCEHEQVLGDACDVCGRPLRAPDVLDDLLPPGPPLEGLEATGHAPVRAAPAAVSSLAELEPTGAPAVPAVLGPPEPWVEATCQPDVAVTVELLEVERTSADGERSPDEAFRTCRYCGELVPDGEAFCLRCAMHAVASGPPREAAAAPVVRCRGCGSVGSGERCRACGERLPEPDVA
jgi:hypothetical protein